jgi:sortase (surface protein transpeptidase)
MKGLDELIPRMFFFGIICVIIAQITNHNIAKKEKLNQDTTINKPQTKNEATNCAFQRQN